MVQPDAATAPPDPVADLRHVTTERLRLDLPVADDLPDLYAVHTDPATWRHFPGGRHTSLEQSERMLADGLAAWAGHGLGYWSVRLRSSMPVGPVIGRGGCAVPAGCPWWNLYFRLSPAVQGRGYAAELGRAALDAAHAADRDRPVLAYLLEHNLASRRTTERLGLRLVWRGPDLGNPDPSAIRLVYTDREPDAGLSAAIEDHCS